MSDEELEMVQMNDVQFEATMKKRSAADRKKAAKQRAKWMKTTGGKKSLMKAKKRAAKVRKGQIKPDRKRARIAKARAKLYSGDEVYESSLDEGPMDGFLRLTFNNPADVKKAMKVSDTEFGYRHFTMDKAKTRPELDIEGDKKDLQRLKDALKSAGIKFKIDLEEEVKVDEGDKEEYTKFFNAALKKFGVDSPADFKSDEEKKKFFDYVDKNYKGDHEEEVKKLHKELFGEVKESYEIGTDEYRKHTEDVTPGEDGEWTKLINQKSQSMREALAKVWGVDEGKSPFKKEEKKENKTMTGKKVASVDINPTIKEKTK